MEESVTLTAAELLELSAYLEFCEENGDLEIAVNEALALYRKFRAPFGVAALQEDMEKYGIRPEMKKILQKCVRLLQQRGK